MIGHTLFFRITAISKRSLKQGSVARRSARHREELGPSYEDKAGRRGIRIADLADRAETGRLMTLLEANVAARNSAIPGDPMSPRRLLTELETVWARLAPMVTDTSVLLHNALAENTSVLFEGAQGSMLDVDHGTFPYVTSSNSTIGGVCTGLGVGPKAIDAVLGIVKVYTTRVGSGPLPTEVTGSAGDRLRECGKEYGASTGRPRRCGWF